MNTINTRDFKDIKNITTAGPESNMVKTYHPMDVPWYYALLSHHRFRGLVDICCQLCYQVSIHNG